jgi:hypothetical protein
MIYITEFKSFYNPNDIVLIEYWYNHMITPVKIIERRGNKFLVSHNTPNSKIQNAPDELISKSDIIDRSKV